VVGRSTWITWVFIGGIPRTLNYSPEKQFLASFEDCQRRFRAPKLGALAMFALQPELKVFTGSANRDLAERICKYIGVPLGQATISSFPDGETYVRIEENIRGHDVFIIQPTCPPTNQHLMELLIMVDAARRASADRITAVIPFFGYARQDRKDQPRVPITAKLVANLLDAAGVSRVLTMDLHAQQV